MVFTSLLYAVEVLTELSFLITSVLNSASSRLICGWLLLALGLEVPRRGQAVSKGWLPLVPGLGPLRKRYGAYCVQMTLI